ncbi:MAG: 30S ribosomal protein S6 [Actinomycetaceae bacterium]|nr:30S ribosomal protein S6 [Actinomycetaceae bacterium]
MRDYEIMVILDPQTDERNVQAGAEKLLQVVSAEGGKVNELDVWGKRRLAYEINKNTEGIYFVAKFSATPDTAKELDRQLGLNESVLRTKLLHIDN